MREKELMKKVQGPFKREENGIGYLTYRWMGHNLTFLEEDVEVYEWYVFNPLEMCIPLYVHMEHRDRDEHELTDKEVKEAVLNGMQDELALFNIRIEEHAEKWLPNPDYQYNERVGVVFFRSPQGLTDEQTAWQHQRKWCILQRYQGGEAPKVVAYADSDKYVHRLRKIFIEEYLGKGYDLFFHEGNGIGQYEYFAQDDKNVLAEYEQDGIYYYNEPKSFGWLSYLVNKADCFCVVEGQPEFKVGNKMVCYATDSRYNEKVREVYLSKYKEKGYHLIEHCMRQENKSE